MDRHVSPGSAGVPPAGCEYILPGTRRRGAGAPRLLPQIPGASRLLVSLLDDLAEVVFADVDDAHFAFGVFLRVAGVRGVDHDGRAEFAADGARRRFGRISRSQHIAD